MKTAFKIGDVVMQRANDPEVGVRAGDIGIVRKVETGGGIESLLIEWPGLMTDTGVGVDLIRCERRPPLMPAEIALQTRDLALAGIDTSCVWEAAAGCLALLKDGEPE